MTISKTLSALYTRQKTFTFIVQVVPCVERAMTIRVGHEVYFLEQYGKERLIKKLHLDGNQDIKMGVPFTTNLGT